ncbi:cysteine proteinase 3-like isoform X2 [Tetranychus urticae]|uniref:cysteine proteinase 3-like isoform X2 n=1 Tax=Tetranychus urticae TaxID=32264 RepID=UPI000D649861|nr:cysteine proteinase 3-like isoform X2 [Tetranychus urticae]
MWFMLGFLCHCFYRISQRSKNGKLVEHSGDGQDYLKCRYTTSNKGASISSFVNVPEADEKSLLSAVAERVVSAAIDAHPVQDYESGIFNTDECSSDPEDLDHGVVIVGYGSEDGTPYWILKNGWGEDFGLSGYFRMYRGNNMCRITGYASYPIV